MLENIVKPIEIVLPVHFELFDIAIVWVEFFDCSTVSPASFLAGIDNAHFLLTQ